MRFSSLVAFMLPLSALAAPLVQSQAQDGINAVRDQIVTDLTTLKKSLGTLHAKGEEIKKKSNKGIVNDIVNTVKDSQGFFEVVFVAATNIGQAITAGKQPEDNDQGKFALNIFKIQSGLGDLQGRIQEAIKPKPSGGNVLPQEIIHAIHGLIGDLNTAKKAADSTIVDGCTIIASQGKNVEDLIKSIGQEVPKNASCPK